ncbi:MAG: sulfatase-like hydrolase/transferase [Planctomycetes bacterium]|nr:sulfatase-like hydrolase/transferase [Planctomycetota bacterium]
MLKRLRQEGRRPVFLQLAVMETHDYWRGPLSLTRPEFTGLFQTVESAAYHQALRQLSRDTGEFLRELGALPGFEDTLFVFTSDHGEGLHSHRPLPYTQFHGAILYESNTLVPLIFRHLSGTLAPRRVSRPVRLIDLVPTLLELVGGAADAEIAGVSLVPLLRGEGAPAGLPELLVAETFFRDYEKQAVYGGAWNYYEHRDGHEGMDAREVQAAGSVELGRLSNKLAEQQGVAEGAAVFLRAFEAAYPRAAAQHRDGELPADLAEELRGLGYLGGKRAPERPGRERR